MTQAVTGLPPLVIARNNAARQTPGHRVGRLLRVARDDSGAGDDGRSGGRERAGERLPA